MVKKINLISALTVNHESARAVFWNYVIGFLIAKSNEECVILVTPDEYERMIIRIGSSLHGRNIAIHKMQTNGRFLDRLAERNWVRNRKLKVRSFLSSFPCIGLVDADYEYFINQNPEIFKIKNIWKTLLYNIAICTLRKVIFLSSGNTTSVRFSVSNYIEHKARLLNFAASRSVVVHSGHDMKVCNNIKNLGNLDNLNRQYLKIVSLSSFAKHKNVEETINLVHFLISRGFSIHLSLVGSWPDPKYEKHIRDLISVLKLTERVKIYGRVSEYEKISILSSSNLYVSSSKMESFGLPILEAEAFGLLCVVKAGSGMSEVLSKVGCIYESFEDVERWLMHLTDNSKKMLNNEGMILSKRNMQDATKKTWKSIHSQLCDIFSRVEGINHLSNKRSVTFLWNGFPDYAARAVGELAKDRRFNVRVIATPATVPIKGMDVSFKGDLITLPEKSRFSWFDTAQPLPDVLFVCGYRVPEFEVLIDQAKRFGSKLVFMSDQDWNSSLFNIVLRPAYHLIFHRSKYRFAFGPGKSSQKVLRSYGYADNLIKYGMYGADPTIFYSRLPIVYRENKIVFVGQLIERKRVMELCHAFIAAAHLNTSWTLDIYGTGPLSDLLPKHQRINYFGFIQPSDLAPILGRSKLLALTSDDEHWGVVVHEAALSGCALLTTKMVGASLDFCSQANSIILPKPTQAEIYKAIVKFMTWDDRKWLSAYDESIRLSKSHGPIKFREQATGIIEKLI